MKSCTRTKLVPFALVATGLVVLSLAGCRKEEEKPVIPPSSPESYMRDPVFRGKLAAERKEYVKLTQTRNAIIEKMKAMVDAKKAELKTDDVKTVRAALEDDPAWKQLHTQCTNANAAVQAQRQRTLGTVRERITPGRGGKDSVSPLKRISK